MIGGPVEQGGQAVRAGPVIVRDRNAGELGLATAAVGGHDQLAGDAVGDVGAVGHPQQVKTEVDGRR